LLYGEWNHDSLAVSDYVKVDPRTLQEYIRKRHEKYWVVRASIQCVKKEGSLGSVLP
jgi:hypothetical protein